ncbi:penicillin-binding protein 1A [Ectothiorhodosinus mongolicus]|uniref:Penicillin-binding protein 1A n=1 Tax=Ectothiorhodosinus mongolicus TaxID=233100 RepID=A0A1R3VUZ5_9GAMM|nr:penicillin-binding protein 1A [Ectothiorhodosinus mongolicus]ULX56866.1 penicillin-binding protein 1A [Ectothiorhodosinus mongolicus]SIT68722.1 penicillin-binding protein 1A [Ectothiorhodosinus mongolicus]
MRLLLAPVKLLLTGVFLALVMGVLMLGAGYVYVAPQLPDSETIRDVRLQVPLRVFSEDGALIAEFGEQRREPMAFDEVPELMRLAFLAAEDDRFETHPGVDPLGLLRAGINLISTGEKTQGGSTITMQVARNYFLQRDKTYTRKLTEIFLALRMEREFSKEEIFELYVNKIFLGQRAYGVGAASRVYYGVVPQELTLPQIAMIAGLPQAPSAANPIANPSRAIARRNYVLRRMHELGFITDGDYAEALETPVTARLHAPEVQVSAGHVAEMVRLEMLARYGERAYTEGFRVYTTVDSHMQTAATHAVRAGLDAYDRRHGYRGPEAQLDLSELTEPAQWDRALSSFPRVAGSLRAGLVTALGENHAEVYLGRDEFISLDLQAVRWARPHNPDPQRGPGPTPRSLSQVLSVGDVIRVQHDAENTWRLSQVPVVEGALVAMDVQSGALKALVGGYDFHRSNFNRATSAERQPGSAFKPFIYAAAFEHGYSPATTVNDAPVVVADLSLDAEWRPRNFSGQFYGPTRLREAMVYSRNLVSIRLLDQVGVRDSHAYLRHFGLALSQHPRALSLALGTGSTTPLEMTRAYGVFASGGRLLEPWLIQRIEDAQGNLLYRWEEFMPPERTISEQNAYQMTSMLRDVIREGTGRRARALGRNDLAGKTGTTNDMRDAWFAGYSGSLVTTAWVGFDQNLPLGARETGAGAALPIWIDFMGPALQGAPQIPLNEPDGMITVRIDAATGARAGRDAERTLFESLTAEQFSRLEVAEERSGEAAGGVTEQIF